jgi:uncharacterized damage-inducible protein DinB
MPENAWWIAEWGNPCRECGFDWAQAPEAVIAAVEELPDKFDAALAGHSGAERAADANLGQPSWSAKAYVFHVADNLRIFAERLEGVFAGAPTTLAAYDQDELAAARDYEAMSLQSALWSVRVAVATWAAAARASLARTDTYQHVERGELNAAEITRGPGHDALHHYDDVTRAVANSATPGSSTPVVDR